MSGTVMISVRVDPTVRTRLRCLATILETSMERVFEEALDRYVRAMPAADRKLLNAMEARSEKHALRKESA